MLKRIRILRGKDYGPQFKTQLILSFMVMTFFVLAASSGLTYITVFEIMKKQLNESTQQRFNQAEYNISSTVDEIDRITKQLIVEPGIQNIQNYTTMQEIERLDTLAGIRDRLTGVIMNYSLVHSIYIIGENGLFFGATKNRFEFVNADRNELKFFSSPLYNRIKIQNKGLSYAGSFFARDFDIQQYSYADGDEHLITIARGVKDTSQAYVATIVVNLYESGFTSVYNNDGSRTKLTIYLADENGRIISCTDKALLMSESEPFQQVIEGGGTGSIIYARSGEKVQVIYKKLTGKGWYIISEIPYSSYYSDIWMLRQIIVFFFAVCVLISFLISIYWIQRITRPLKQLAVTMQKLEKGSLNVRLDEKPKNELGLVGRQFNQMSASIFELVEKVKRIESQKLEYEMESLRAQINPHFLYNSLNIIKWMAIAVGASNVADAMTALGNILKPIFKESSHLCSLQDEISYMENYIRIMNYRFGEGLMLHTDIPRQMEQMQILRFILQPIVENSIVHGMSGNRRTLEIRISAEEYENDLLVKVSDDGDGMDESQLQQIYRTLAFEGTEKADRESKSIFSVGLVNVNKRIKLYFGSQYGLSIRSSQGKGTEVHIRIPQIHEGISEAPAE